MDPVGDFDQSPRGNFGLDQSPRPLLEGDQPRASFVRLEHHAIGNGRKFTSDSITFPKNLSVDTFVDGFAATRKMANQFARTLEETAQFLYQRKARKGTIVKSHDAIKKTIETQYSDLTATLATMNDNAKFIPHMHDRDKIASCLGDRFAFAVLQPLRRKEFQKLSPVLESNQHKAVLEFCKTKKSDCKELRKPGDAEERVRKLYTIFDETIAKCKEIMPAIEGQAQEIYRQTSKLFEEQFKFIAYTSTFPPKKEKPVSWYWTATGYGWAWGGAPVDVSPPQNDPQLARQLEILREKVTEQREALAAARKKAVSPRKVVQVDPANIDYAQYNDKKPDSSSAFRSGWGIEELFYSEMSDELQVLKTVAVALSEDFKDITDHLVTHTVMPEDQLKTLEARLAAHKAKIHQEDEKLKQLPISSKIQAGWYYVERLKEMVRTVEMYCKHLKKLSTRDLGLYFQAFTSLMEYLKPADNALARDPTYFTSCEAVHRLYAAIRGGVLLNKPVQPKRSALIVALDIVNTIDQTIAAVGPRTLDHTSEEVRAVRSILARLPFASFQEFGEDSIVLKAVESFLLKGFIYKLYFLNSSEVDTEFEIILDIMLSDAQYARSIQQLFQQNTLLQELYHDYAKRSDMDKYLAELRLMSKLFQARTEKPSEFRSAVSDLFEFCKTSQILLELQAPLANISDQHRARREWAKTKRLQPRLGYPDYFYELGNSLPIEGDIPKLFKNVVTSLFSQDPLKRETATIQAQAICDTLPKELFADNPYMKMLVTGWQLLQHVAKGKKEGLPYDSTLSTFFNNYLTNRETRENWKHLKGISFMERALYLADKNRGEGHEIWNQVLYYYCDYYKPLQAEGHITKCITKAREALQEVDLARANANSAKTAAVYCFSEILLDYIRKLSFEFCELLTPNQILRIPKEDALPAYERQVPEHERTLYTKLKGILQAATNAFGGEITLAADDHENPQLQEAQTLFIAMRLKLQRQSFPFK